jgi:hypothetical protein
VKEFLNPILDILLGIRLIFCFSNPQLFDTHLNFLHGEELGSSVDQGRGVNLRILLIKLLCILEPLISCDIIFSLFLSRLKFLPK